MVLFAIPVSKDAAVSKLALITNQKRASTVSVTSVFFPTALRPGTP